MWIELWIEVWVWISTNRRHGTGSDWRRLEIVWRIPIHLSDMTDKLRGCLSECGGRTQPEASNSLHLSARGLALIMGFEQSDQR